MGGERASWQPASRRIGTFAILVLLAGTPLCQADPALPESLDAWYPPESAEPVFLYAMMDLGHAYSAVQRYLERGELDRARTDFGRFAGQYTELRDRVPEWSERFPAEPLAAVQKALDGADIPQALAALGGLRRVCGACHGQAMIAAQQKYHWGDFGAVRAMEPVSGEAGTFSRLKWSLQDSFSSLINDARHGEQTRAKQLFGDFQRQLDSLAGTCETCHSSERRYYVDEASMQLVGQLGTALAHDPLNPEEVAGIARQVNLQICFQCHLVHMPAAFARGH